jgi:putative transposon-encoded protein
MVRRMKATITQIESVVTPSGNSGHVVVPKAWIIIYHRHYDFNI